MTKISRNYNPPFWCHTLEEFFNYETEYQTITNKLQKIIKQTLPKAKEGIKWGVPFYAINKNICFLSYHKSEDKLLPTLSFYNGNIMFDNHRLFENTSHVKIKVIRFTELNEEIEEVLKDYLEQAGEIDRSMKK